MADARTVDFDTDSGPIMRIVVFGHKAGSDREAVFPAAGIVSCRHALSEADLLEGCLVEVLAHDRLPAVAG
jgi:hypothetical protein